MDGRYFKTDSKFSLKKCVGGSNSGVDSIIELSDENGVDRISELPDGIIIFILSFLSLREAISTSVLSSRWPALWKYTPNINFNTKLIKTKPRMQMPWELRSCDMEKCEYIQMVNSVLQSHEALSLKEFRLSLYVNKSAECSVAKWLKYLFSRQVEILELDFLCKYDMDKVCLGASLRDSKLCLPQTDVVLFKSLKRLCLKCMKVSGEDIDLFLHNCPLLEQMSIHHTRLTSDVVFCGTTLMLKHLDIYCCTGQISIKVSSPELTWLRVHTASNNKLLLENLPKLIRADFTVNSETLDDANDFSSSVFGYISRLTFLYLSIDNPKVFLWNGFPQMPKLKRLKISYSGVYGHGLMPITALIWASPRLKEFKLEFINLARNPTPWREGLINDVTRPPHRHLKTLKFEGFCVDAADHIELVTYILNNCVVLQNLIISCFPLFETAADDLTDSEEIAQFVADRLRAEQLLKGLVPHHIKLRIL